MNVYTKTGDHGETSLFGGTRTGKDSLRVDCYGTVDEATSLLGVAYSFLEFEDLKKILRAIQNKMFVVGAQLASDEKGHEKLKVKITKDDIKYLEKIIDDYTEEFGKIKSFVIPGETQASSFLHVARTVVRRAERNSVSLSKSEFVCPLVLKYLNRLSDALFILARMEVFKSFVRKVAERITEVAGLGIYPEGAADFCDELARVAYQAAQEEGLDICFSIVDEAGDLKYFKRFGDSLLISVDISQKKAYTAVALKTATGNLTALTRNDGAIYGLHTTDPRLVVFAGGFPLFKNGKLLGAIGISGGAPEQDERIGKKVLEAFEKLNK